MLASATGKPESNDAIGKTLSVFPFGIDDAEGNHIGSLNASQGSKVENRTMSARL